MIAAPAYTHLIADFIGVPAPLLRDSSLLSGLLIAAASAAGLNPVFTPVVRQLPNDDVGAVLLLEDCHMVVHALARRHLLMLDIFAPAAADTGKALDVFARRLGPREIYRDTRARG
jgi:S-adenosylmethionine/arginine decarboxylase-like enzyme